MNSLITEHINLQNQIGNRSETLPVFMLFSDQMAFAEASLTLKKKNIGHAFTVGHQTNGVVGIANGIDGQQIVVGAQAMGTEVVVFEETYL